MKLEPFANKTDGARRINSDAYEDILLESNRVPHDLDMKLSPPINSNVPVPPPVSTFADMGLSNALIGNIQRCKRAKKKPTMLQSHTIPLFLKGWDLMVFAQTRSGPGKKADICLPVIAAATQKPNVCRGIAQFVSYPLVLILTPTMELACEIGDEAIKLSSQMGLDVVVPVNYTWQEFIRQLEDLQDQRKDFDILVGTPTTIAKIFREYKVSFRELKYLVLDEADRMLAMGFEPEIKLLTNACPMTAPGGKQTMLFSATLSKEVLRLASDLLWNYIFLAVGRVGSSTDLIVQRVKCVHESGRSRFHALKKNGLQEGSGDSDGDPRFFDPMDKSPHVDQGDMSSNREDSTHQENLVGANRGRRRRVSRR